MPALGRRAFGQSQQVNVLNWDTYIGETTLEDFTDATGIAVRYDLFASNDELFAKLRGGNPGYDVIFPTNDYVERMIAADMLLPLDHAKIPNMANIDPAFADPAFDPGLAHSMPYFWGTVGLGYRSSAGEPDRIRRPVRERRGTPGASRCSTRSTRSTRRSSISAIRSTARTRRDLDEVVEVLTRNKSEDQVLRAGHRPGSADLRRGRRLPRVQRRHPPGDGGGRRPRLRRAGGRQRCCGRTTCASREGGPNPENAHTFINFILDAEVHGAIATYVRYPCPNAAALDFIPEEDRQNPRSTRRARCSSAARSPVYKGEEIESLYANALTRVLAA